MKSIILAAAAGLFATGFAAHALAQTAPLDPYCMKEVPWAVDASGPIRIFGCRAAGQVPAANAQGWVEYDDPNGGFLRARKVSEAGGVWTLDVQYNGGGSGTFPFKVTGAPGATGVLANSNVAPLPASNAN